MLYFRYIKWIVTDESGNTLIILILRAKSFFCLLVDVVWVFLFEREKRGQKDAN